MDGAGPATRQSQQVGELTEPALPQQASGDWLAPAIPEEVPDGRSPPLAAEIGFR